MDYKYCKIINNDEKIKDMDQKQVLKFLYDNAAPNYTCNRPPGAAGALLVPVPEIICHVNNSHIYAIMTYVNAPDFSPSCKRAGCEYEYSFLEGDNNNYHQHCVRTIHAEQRAIAIAARLGVATEGAIIYSLLKPCYNCTKLIIAAGIKTIYYGGTAYDEERTRRILTNAHINSVPINGVIDY